MTSAFGIAVFICCLAAVPAAGYATGSFLAAVIPGFPVWLLPVVFILCSASLPFSYALPKGALRRAARRTGECWLGIAMYLTAGILAALPFCLTGLVTPTAAGLIAAAVFVLLYGGAVINALFIRTRRVEYRSAKLSSPLRIALVSDLHLGFTSDRNMVTRIAGAIRRCRPDLVLISGDIFDAEYSGLRHPSDAEAAFRSIGAPIYACEGNHDLFDDCAAKKNFFENSGIHLLKDESAEVRDVLVRGLRDKKDPLRAAVGRHESSLLTVTLDHHPDAADKLCEAGSDLVLCGHTHAGQTFPGNLLLRLLSKRSYGEYRLGGSLVYVTSGAGFWGPPLRLGVCNEVVVIDVVPE